MLLKKGVLPRFFDCQSDRKRASSMPIRPAIKKLKKLRILQEINEKEIKKKFQSEKRSVSEDSQNFLKDIVDPSDHLTDLPTNPLISTDHSNLSTNNKVLNLKEFIMADESIQVFIRPSYRSVRTYCNMSTPMSVPIFSKEVKEACCSPIKIIKVQDNVKSSISDSTTNTSKTLNDTLED